LPSAFCFSTSARAFSRFSLEEGRAGGREGEGEGGGEGRGSEKDEEIEKKGGRRERQDGREGERKGRRKHPPFFLLLRRALGFVSSVLLGPSLLLLFTGKAEALLLLLPDIIETREQEGGREEAGEWGNYKTGERV